MEEKEEIRIKKEIGDLKERIQEMQAENERMALVYKRETDEYKKAMVKMADEVTNLKGQVKAYRKVLRV